MIKRIMCAVMALVMLLSVGIAAAEEEAEEKIVIGVDLDGNEVTEDILVGAKLTITNVWGTFCGPCINEMPYLGQLAEEYADRGVRIIGIVCDVDESMPTDGAKSIVEATGANYTHLLFNELLYYCFICQSEYIPITWLLDENGQLLESEPRIGSMSYEGWKDLIDTYLAAAE